MKTKSQIAKIIYDELNYIYCFNCRYDNVRDNCDDCSRKSMGWEISQEEANKIADKILE